MRLNVSQCAPSLSSSYFILSSVNLSPSLIRSPAEDPVGDPVRSLSGDVSFFKGLVDARVIDLLGE